MENLIFVVTTFRDFGGGGYCYSADAAFRNFEDAKNFVEKDIKILKDELSREYNKSECDEEVNYKLACDESNYILSYDEEHTFIWKISHIKLQ